MTTLTAQPFTPPKTPVSKVVDTLHGVLLTDEYQWLENKDDAVVIDWTHAQHKATTHFVESNCSVPKGFEEEVTAYIDRDIEGPVRLVADRQFFSLKKKGEAQYKLYTKLNGENVLIFDPIALDPSGKTAMSGLSYTENAAMVAVGVQHKGAEISTYYIVDTKTGKQLGEPITGLRGFSWTKDSQHAYITVGTKEMLEQQIPLKTYLHKIGTDRSQDQFLVAPDDAKNFAYIYDARYSDVSFIGKGDFYATHSLAMRSVGTFDEAIPLYSSQKYRADASAIGDKIYFYTNHEAPNFKIMVADKSQPQFEHWKELYGEKETVLESFVVTKDYLIVQDKKDVLSRILIHDLAGNFIKELQLPELGDVSSIHSHRESNSLFVSLSTFTAPTKIFKLDASQLTTDDLVWELYYQSKVAVDTENITGKVDFYPSKDGTKVPVFIIHQKGIELNGQNPTLLYGYGGFNVGIKPSFVHINASFINRGGVYVIAGIRGGDEYGEQWHEDGMLHKKQNCFDDFIAAAEYLIQQKYTNPKKLAIYGGSNGGLLIGAMITQRPDLFKAAVCSVPLLDMIRFHKFLIARYWIPEYGDPEKAEDFNYLLTYSPYHNIRRGVNLPTTLFIAGENDTRVDPLHAKKMVAALQNNIGQINPILLYMDYDSGHGTGKSTEQIIYDQVFRWRFIMQQLGMTVEK